MKTTRGFVLAALAVVITLAWCGQALAQGSTDDAARAQFETGTELFDQGKYEQAATAFARAYEIKPTFRLLYNIAQVENELGHFARALDAYTRYLAEGGDEIEVVRRDEVRTEIARLNNRVGMITINGPDGATVFVDGRRSGTTPFSGPLFVDLGEHEVVVKQGSNELHREVVKVAGGQFLTVNVDGDASGEFHSKRTWTWVAFGVGGAAAITGAITGGVSWSKTKDLQDQCTGNVCAPGLQDDLDQAEALGDASTALFVIGGVGVAAGIVLFFLEPKWSKNESAVEVAPVATPTAHGGAFALVGRF